LPGWQVPVPRAVPVLLIVSLFIAGAAAYIGSEGLRGDLPRGAGGDKARL
jgi:hypothetical protein